MALGEPRNEGFHNCNCCMGSIQFSPYENVERINVTKIPGEKYWPFRWSPKKTTDDKLSPYYRHFQKWEG